MFRTILTTKNIKKSLLNFLYYKSIDLEFQNSKSLNTYYFSLSSISLFLTVIGIFSALYGYHQIYSMSWLFYKLFVTAGIATTVLTVLCYFFELALLKQKNVEEFPSDITVLPEETIRRKRLVIFSINTALNVLIVVTFFKFLIQIIAQGPEVYWKSAIKLDLWLFLIALLGYCALFLNLGLKNNKLLHIFCPFLFINKVNVQFTSYVKIKYFYLGLSLIFLMFSVLSFSLLYVSLEYLSTLLVYPVFSCWIVFSFILPFLFFRAKYLHHTKMVYMG
ncbi:hypothetical protein [Mycoplasma nasistruthionis]|uniref:Uncharacterized protein n=1 Tax=Mycoplasma nasistruthionis TaxID=353852 RepID=A0A4Y6I756_9MOLU|nr:hypothetical protein [Mycoplasma nasistruthionis]QCZ36948.1 hypothetical protein FG904_02965 [Mycoplasma nasistruthionis]QDF65221.1 hypothetical protein FIV53_02920 [Mycoplasma nasistruthionis]